VFGELDFLSGLGRGRVIVGMFSARSALFWDFFSDVGLASGLVRRGRLIVGTSSARAA